MEKLIYKNIIILFLSLLLNFCQAESDPKYGSTRLENDTSFDVPETEVKNFWENLQKKFKNGWQHQNLKLNTQVEVEQFVDTYFDTPEKTLINQWTGLRHRRRFYSNGDIKELIQLKITTTGATNQVKFKEQTRQEVKYELANPTVIPGVEPSDQEDLNYLIKRTQLPLFIEKMKELGVEASRLRPVLTLKQERRRIYFNLGDKRIFTVTLDLAKSKKFWLTANFTQLDIEISEITFTGSNQAEREKLFDLQYALYQELQTTFPFLKRNQTPKIILMLNQFKSQGVIAECLLKYGEKAFVAIGIIFLLLFLLLLRRQHRQKYF